MQSVSLPNNKDDDSPLSLSLSLSTPFATPDVYCYVFVDQLRLARFTREAGKSIDVSF